MLEETQRVKSQTTAERDTVIWRGFVIDSKGRREGGVGTQCLC